MKRFLVVLLLCAVAAFAYGQTRQSTQTQSGRYVVVVSSEGGTAWRLDTVSGGLVYCLTAQIQVVNGLGNPGQKREAVCTQMIP